MSIEDKLGNMKHLDSLKEIAEETTSAKKEVKDLNDPKLEEVYTFNFEWSSPTGRKYEGKFTHKVPSIKDYRTIGIMKSKLAGGVPPETLDVTTADINYMLAYFTVTLDTSLNPQDHWSKNLEEVRDLRVLYSLYEEAASHEATFLGS